MQIESNYSLLHHNSFGFDIRSRYFCRATSTESVRAAIAWSDRRGETLLVLGEGSNTVFTGDINGLTLHIKLDQLEFNNIGNQQIMVTAGAGINWHELVQTTLQHGYYGLENLALIPGSVGAAPIQNIGAYGRDIADFLHSVEVLDRRSGATTILTAQQCRFGYRDSLFKHAAGGDFIVLAVRLILTTQQHPHTSYQSLANSLSEAGIEHPDARTVFNHVCSIRREKLPDPARLGNAGSFFKNPVVSAAQFAQLQQKWPQIPCYIQPDGRYKLAAGWLIEQAGWKGYRREQIGVHRQQALVLVNHGGGTGQQIAILAADIQRDIQRQFDVKLETEPGII